MENQLVESVTKFTYLGSDVVSGSSSTPEVHKRIGLANSIVGQLDGVWRNRILSLNTKLRLFCYSSGNALASINVVALRQTRLVLGWVTVCGRVNHFDM